MNRGHGIDRMPPGHEVLALELVAGTRRVVHPEVWQTIVPGTRDAELLGAGVRRHSADRVERDRRDGRPVKSG